MEDLQKKLELVLFNAKKREEEVGAYYKKLFNLYFGRVQNYENFFFYCCLYWQFLLSPSRNEIFEIFIFRGITPATPLPVGDGGGYSLTYIIDRDIILTALPLIKLT